MNIKLAIIALVAVLPTLVLSLDRCNNPNPDCSSCTSNEICVGTDYGEGEGGIFRRAIEYNCDNYQAGFYCCNNSECGSGSSCESNICKDDHITPKGCTQDYECNGKGGYCCVKTGQCGGPNSCK